MKTRRSDFQGRFGVVRFRKIAAVAAGLFISITGAAPVFAVDNLIDHTGQVLTSPNLYITYWGIDWQNGFFDGTSGLPSITYRAYLEDFLNGVGGGSWIGSQLQYRSAGGPSGVVKGIWIDTTHAIPATPTQGQMENEVRFSVNHFNTESDPQAVYLIALPPGHGDTDFGPKGGTSCAWHSRAWNNNIIDVKFFPYINLPYTPDAPKGCATNVVNKGFDFSGHGIFDGVSKVAGHEWAEMLTDPHMNAWYGNIGLTAETGDKCNGGPFNNIRAGGDYYAVQALWSNNDGGCVLAGVPSADQSPTSYDFGVAVRYSSSGPLTVQLANNGDLDLPLDFINNTPWYLIGANASDFWLWSNTCGKILHPGATCQVQAYFRPTDLGPRQAVLGARVPFGVNQTGNSTPLSGNGINQWELFDPSTIVFTVGALIHSAAPPPELPIKLNNTGDTPRLIQRVRLGGPHPSDFLILGDGCSDHELGPLESCAVVLGFTPTATGDRQAELEVTDATGSAFGVPVLGTGLGPVAQLSTTNLSFGDATYNSDGVATGEEIPVLGEVHQEITFTNTGQSPLEVSGVEVTGDFALNSNGCTQPLQPNDSCVIQVRLMPTHFQFQSGTLMIYDNTSNSPHEVKLTGSVVAPIPSLVPDEVQFGSVPVGSTSSPQTVRLENLEGYASLHIQSITATGDFTATSDCPSELLIGNCAITVTLTPTAAGPRSGMLLVTDNAPRSPHQIPLIGTGCTKGDLDCDGDVDQNDLNILLSHRNQPASACPACDLDGDGTITALDARKLVLLCTRPRCATQ